VATIQKFYLHDAALSPAPSPNAPGASSLSGATPGVTATGASTNRAMTGSAGSAQASAALSTLASTTAQVNWFRRFVSAPMAAQTIGAGNWVLSGAASESAAQSNLILWRGGVYRYRPSDDTTATIFQDVTTNTTPGTEPGTTQTAISSTWAGSGTTLVAGDVIVLELWGQNTQANGTSRTNTIFYDGTTEASTTNCATFLDAPAALTLLDTFTGAAAISGGGSLTATGSVEHFGAAAISGGGTASATGIASYTDAAALNGGGTASATGLASYTGAAALDGGGTLSPTGLASYAGAAALDGGGTASATGLAGYTGAAILDGGGTLSATGSQEGDVGDPEVINLQDSILATHGPFMGWVPIPEGTLDQADRQHQVGVYRGILSGGADQSGAAALDGGGTVSATGSVEHFGAATLDGGGTASATGDGGAGDPDVMNLQDSVLGTHGPFMGWVPIPSGTLDQADRQHQVGVYRGILAGDAEQSGAAILDGGGTLSAAGLASYTAAATLDGGGTLTASGLATYTGAAALSGGGTLSATGLASYVATALLDGGGSLAATGSVEFFAAALLDGGGTVSATGLAGYVGAALLDGGGTLGAAGAAVEPGAGAALLSGGGTLTATGSVEHFASAALSGGGTLSAPGLGT
jgi:fibronectin-binding autotransporter adhesin